MLPASVSELLKEGKAAEDVLQEWPEITILFCYITGFKELTTSCDPYDVVDFVNSLFSSFDKVCYRADVVTDRNYHQQTTSSIPVW